MKLISYLMLSLIISSASATSNDSAYNYMKLTLDSVGVQHSDIVAAQAMLESGWMKCTKCSLSRNNPFGFWYKKKYVSFDSIKEACLYYKRWQDRHYKGGDYYEFLECGRKHSDGTCMPYATEPNYVFRLQNIVKNYG